jgi:Ca2+-binding RTX toxin-like protein
MAIYTYKNTTHFPSGTPLDYLVVSNDGLSNADVQIRLSQAGTLTAAFGFLDGVAFQLTTLPDGDGANDVIQLVEYFNSTGIGPTWRAGVLWDEQTQTNFGVGMPANTNPNGVWYDLYGANRYGLPSANATVRYETILGSNGDDLVKLDYNAANGGIPYEWDITMVLGGGRDLGIGGEGNDAIFGGSEDTDLGDGLWGMGGNDTLYGGFNFTGLGADDLYGYAGNDTIYGHNDGDVYYGDSGNDTIFVAGNQGSIAFVSEPGHSLRAWGGSGSDTIFAGIVPGAVQFYYGGNPSPTWTDAAFVETPDNADNPGIDVDLVSYFSAAGGVGIDLQVNTIVDSGTTLTIGQGGGTGINASTGHVYFGIEAIIGSNVGGDTLTGGHGANTLSGVGGNDTLFGEGTADGVGGADTLFGGDGNDTMFSSLGADSMSGGAGIDTLTYSTATGAVTISMTSGSGSGDHGAGDVIAGDIEVLVGSSFNDFLTGAAVAETIFGGAGIDTIRGSTGNDSLTGGGQGDWVSYEGAASAVTVNLTSNTATGGDGADALSGFLNIIGSGNDDFLTGTNAANSVLAGGGNDSVVGDNGDDVLSGEAGNDELFGGNQNDTLYGGADDDMLDGGGSADSLQGGLGNDTVVGGAGADSLLGDDGNDTMFGGTEVDTIDGGLGDDTVVGGAGGDIMNGQGGANFLSYEGSDAAVTVNLATNAVSGGHGNGDVYSNFANAIGSDHNDSFTGSSGVNTIIGGAGSDTVNGGLGDDVMYGGVNFGVDNENDWLTYNASASAVQVSLFLGTATGGLGSDTFGAFQHLIGSASSNDFLEGDDDNNSILGQGGNDTLSGLGSIDSLFGGGGDDLILAGTNGGTFENTTISGWDGEAGSAAVEVFVPIFSARVSDRMFGGTGADTVDMQNLVSAPNSVLNSGDSTISNYIAGIEIIIAGAAADVINLSFNDGVTQTAYGENVTIFAGDNADVVFSGSGSDLVVGGRQNGVDVGELGDTLYGGAGNDTVFGDDQNASNFGGADLIFAGAGNDTAYGGVGSDSVSGNAGNDSLFDFDGADIFGGDGADLLIMQGSTGGNYTLVGGVNAGTDGADLVFAGGEYDTVTSTLGEGADQFYASDVDAGTAQTDRVAGENGNDLVSTWFGSDTVDGGSGADVIWGGAGSDTIYGGADSDILYGGAGDGDVLVGGPGIDYYYWSRTDGDDLIDDADPGALPGTGAHVNAILVFPDFATETTAGSDGLLDGSGVFETDQDLYDNAGGDDMVQLVDIGGGMMELHILNGAGAGSVMTFEQDDISVIALWNNDAAAGTPVITQYVWNEGLGEYVYTT